jgi:hypothetical protein
MNRRSFLVSTAAALVVAPAARTFMTGAECANWHATHAPQNLTATECLARQDAACERLGDYLARRVSPPDINWFALAVS